MRQKIGQNEEKDQEPVIESAEDIAETVVPGISQDEYQSIRNGAIERAKNTKHAWVMKGRGKLVCTSCDFPHVSYIPMNKTLVGIDDQGLPILKTLQ